MYSRTDWTPRLAGGRWREMVGSLCEGGWGCRWAPSFREGGDFHRAKELREKMQIFEKPVKGGLIQSNQLNRKT